MSYPELKQRLLIRVVLLKSSFLWIVLIHISLIEIESLDNPISEFIFDVRIDIESVFSLETIRVGSIQSYIKTG